MTTTRHNGHSITVWTVGGTAHAMILRPRGVSIMPPMKACHADWMLAGCKEAIDRGEV